MPRRNFLVPVPSYPSFDALNSYLEERCLERLGRRLRGHDETIGQRMERDLDALLPLQATHYDASDRHVTRVQLSVPGEVPHQRLLCARGLRSSGCAGAWLCGQRW